MKALRAARGSVFMGRTYRERGGFGQRPRPAMGLVTVEGTDPRTQEVLVPALHTAPLRFRRLDPAAAPRDLPVEPGRDPSDYEFRVAVVPRRTSLSALRAALASEAEYGRWELARTRLYHGGGKQVWLRRRSIRVRSTLT